MVRKAIIFINIPYLNKIYTYTHLCKKILNLPKPVQNGPVGFFKWTGPFWTGWLSKLDRSKMDRSGLIFFFFFLFCWRSYKYPRFSLLSLIIHLELPEEEEKKRNGRFLRRKGRFQRRFQQ